ncbi:RtcB family protein [Anatilimnocola sp. NA78]|uniref:RtcB family protein n=1 Tax=Anatilimnocola sp. NA78 TaxID=3415683 RepID=UPI003CE52FA7
MAKSGFYGPLEQVNDCLWRIPKSYKEGMLVDGLIFADELLMELIRKDQAAEQVANVAFLPGIQSASLAMPDIHWGYGFCIGGVAATDPNEGGVISPGGVGYDINCGVRLVRSSLFYQDVKPHLKRLMDTLYSHVPAGLGQEGKYRFSHRELRDLMGKGASYLKKRGLVTANDLDHTEAGGYLNTAEPDFVSERALTRGAQQCGTLGSGNHFLEVQVVDAIFDADAAQVMGLEKDMVCVMIHSGSRGLGYQVCDDALRELRQAPAKYGIHLPDKQLVCAPVNSDEGRQYLGAMSAAANYAWCNRQLLMWQARESFELTFGKGWEALHMSLVYDVAHNIAKLEEHTVNGAKKKVWVHRKGATRAFPKGHPEVPSQYASIGQPVIIPGDMGRASWVLFGAPGSMEQSFGSACHGAGRVMSRTAAVAHAAGRRIDQELLAKGIEARARSWRGLAEEQPDAYKNVDQVVDVVHRANLATKVARMRPIGVVKG